MGVLGQRSGKNDARHISKPRGLADLAGSVETPKREFQFKKDGKASRQKYASFRSFFACPPMLLSLFAAFFYALNAACAYRSSRVFGASVANVGRLIVGAIVLGFFAYRFGHSLPRESIPWFVLSGVIGMGIGDLGIYAALPLLGSRLSMLIMQSLAAPIAALGEWWWLGTRLTLNQILAGLVILAGVAIAVAPSRKNPPRVPVRAVGFIFALVAAAGQGLGALVSRKGMNVAQAAGESTHNVIFGLTSAYHRALGGFVFIIPWLVLIYFLRRYKPIEARSATGSDRRTGWKWMLANGVTGPVAGMGSYQWALATTPSGIVLSIAATTPLWSIPIAYWMEGDRPERRAVVGGFVAVAGCIWLTLTR